MSVANSLTHASPTERCLYDTVYVIEGNLSSENVKVSFRKQALLKHLKEVTYDRSSYYCENGTLAKEEDFEHEVLEYKLSTGISFLRDCWIVFGDSYDSGDCVWGVFASEKESRAYLSQELAKDPTLTEEDDFEIFQPTFDQIID